MSTTENLPVPQSLDEAQQLIVDEYKAVCAGCTRRKEVLSYVVKLTLLLL